MISRADENALKVALTKKINEWWDELSEGENSGIILPYVGDNITEIMATAALSVLLAVDDTQDYLYQEDIIKE